MANKRQSTVSTACVVEKAFKLSALSVAILLLPNMPAQAFQFETGSDWEARWDNTLKYSNAWRVKDQHDKLVADPNLDDGDRNFDQGLISNRLDLLSELDISRNGAGLRVSGAAWYDDVYNKDNDNDSPDTANAFSVDHDEFTDDKDDPFGEE